MKQDSLAPSLKHRLWKGDSPPTTSMSPGFLWFDNNVCLLALTTRPSFKHTHTCQGSRTPETSGLRCSFSAFSSFFGVPFSVHVFCSILSPLNYSMSVIPVSSEVTVKNLVQPGKRGSSGRMTSDGSYSLKFLPWSWENFFSEELLYITVCHWRKSRQKSRDSNWSRSHGGMLLTGIFLMVHSPVLLYHPGLPAQGGITSVS